MDINILTHIGISYKVNMDNNSILKNLKIKVRDMLGLQFDEQCLLYMNNIMDDDNIKLTQYGLSDGCEVKLITNFKKESFRICIEMQGGVSFDIDVLSKDTLTDVKRKIQGHCKLTPEEQIMVYQGSILEGNSDITSFGVQDKSVVHVLHRLVNAMQIFVGTMEGDIFACDVTSSDRVIDIKKKIQEKIGWPLDIQKLVYQGGILEDEKTVDEYQIAEDCVINVVTRFRNGFQIFAESMDGKTIAFEVTKSYNVFEIKKNIQEKLGLLADEQILVYQGKILEDIKTVDEYQITEKSVINVVTRLRNGFQIFAKTMDGKTIAFEVTKSYNVFDIKKKIQEKIGLSPEEQKLIYQGVILEDIKTVEEYQITEKSVINVVARWRWMQIFAKTMDGKTIAFDVTMSDKVIDIKKKIQEKIGLSVEEQKLVYQGGILEDEKTVEEYQIAEKSVINVVTRLRNGFQIFAKSMDGKTIAFEVTKSYKVIDIKKKIQEKIGLSVEEQKLLYQGIMLVDEKTVEECQIAEKSVINVVARLR